MIAWSRRESVDQFTRERSTMFGDRDACVRFCKVSPWPSSRSRTGPQGDARDDDVSVCKHGRKESGLEISTSVVRVIASIGVDYSASSLFRFRLFDGKKKSGVAIRGCQVIESGE